MKESIQNLKQKLMTEEKHDFTSLRELVTVLRSPEGCPWDHEQTHPSIRTDLIEETYEVVEAIDKDDRTLLREELGDVLFQVMFHSSIEEEAGTFSIEEVIDDVCRKMISRHPHVFGTVKVNGTDDVLDNWDKIKTVEKSRTTPKSVLEAVPRQYPALLRAKKVVKKARKNGWSFGTEEERSRSVAEKAAAYPAAAPEDKENLLTELLFETVMLAGADMDLEKDLTQRVDAFIEAYPEEE